MKRPVPILITWDVDPWPGLPIENRKRALRLTYELLKELQIESTFFCVTMVACHLEKEISSLIEAGHEIGCHGLTHTDEEEYDKMPEDMQRIYLRKATDALYNTTGTQAKSFRGPRVKTSHITQGILEELGYVADCSVASQRIDFVSSNLVNVGWIFAPRLPYHPSEDDAFNRGERSIWAIPISAMLLPFISATLNVFGLNFMKNFFDILYRESLRSGKPIVYLAHPSEFALPTMKIEKPGLSIKTIRTHGLLFRARFYEQDRQKRFDMNRDLLVFMKSYPNVRFMKVSDFVAGLSQCK